MEKQNWFLLERAKGFDLFQTYPIADSIADNGEFEKNFGVSLKNIAIVIDKYTDICCVKANGMRLH